MVTHLFLSCYANEIPLSSSYKKIREILGTDYFSHMLDQATLTLQCEYTEQIIIMMLQLNHNDGTAKIKHRVK